MIVAIPYVYAYGTYVPYMYGENTSMVQNITIFKQLYCSKINISSEILVVCATYSGKIWRFGGGKYDKSGELSHMSRTKPFII